MASPAPINEINNSRPSRGHGVGSADLPAARDVVIISQVSNESLSPSWAAVAAARREMTGSVCSTDVASITISLLTTLIFLATDWALFELLAFREAL